MPRRFSVVLDLRFAADPPEEDSRLADHARFWVGLKPKLQRIALVAIEPLAWGLLFYSDVLVAGEKNKFVTISEDHLKTLSIFSNVNEAIEWARIGK
jgi:hypothetical protein